MEWDGMLSVRGHEMTEVNHGARGERGGDDVRGPRMDTKRHKWVWCGRRACTLRFGVGSGLGDGVMEFLGEVF